MALRLGEMGLKDSRKATGRTFGALCAGPDPLPLRFARVNSPGMLPIPILTLSVGLAQTTADPDPSKAILARQALALLVALILICTLVVTCLLLFMALRRSKQRREKPASPTKHMDPWGEAGRRAESEPPMPVDDSLGDTRVLPSVTDPPPESPPPQTPSVPVEPQLGSMPHHIDAPRPLALITGGARRVGLASALALARAGCDIVITFNTSQAEANDAADQLRQAGARVRLEQIDLADLHAVEKLGQRLSLTMPRLDVLVHNASVYDPAPLAGVGAEFALMQYRVNALAPLLLTKHLAPLLAKSSRPGGGAVVAMADIHAMGRPRRDFSAYSMSKAALIEMIQSLARELAPRIRVNGVAPGVVAFPEHGHESDASFQQKYVARVPLGRAGEPADAAEVVRWLALDASYVTGEIIRVDGGRWLA